MTTTIKPVVTFEQNEKGYVGYIIKPRKKTIVNFVRQEKCGLFSLWKSMDGGRSFRMLPRIDCSTEAACYYRTADQAMGAANDV